jgi:membrane-associated PAP2 superfamily phosphatase
MTDNAKLTLVRVAHNLVYVVMAISVFAMLYAGVTGARGPWLPVAVVFVLAEAGVYVFNGMRCPLTLMARKYGAGGTKGYALDTVLSERAAGHCFKFLTAVGAAGLVLLVVQRITAG